MCNITIFVLKSFIYIGTGSYIQVSQWPVVIADQCTLIYCISTLPGTYLATTPPADLATTRNVDNIISELLSVIHVLPNMISFISNATALLKR